MSDTALKERVTGLEQFMMELAYETTKTTMAVRQLSEEMKDFKEEMKDFKDEMKDFKNEIRNDTKAFKEDIRNDTKAFKEEMRMFKTELRSDTEKLKKEMNKKWGELANKMGTIVEDIVAPGLTRVAAEYFGISEFDFFAPRLRLKSADRSMTREFDVIAESNDYF
ncbi:hypothetical protein, partial [Desulfobacter latus]